MKTALITYLCNDLFAPGALALLESIKENSPDILGEVEILCFCLEDVTRKMQDILIKTISGADFTNESRIKDLLNFVASDSESASYKSGKRLISLRCPLKFGDYPIYLQYVDTELQELSIKEKAEATNADGF